MNTDNKDLPIKQLQLQDMTMAFEVKLHELEKAIKSQSYSCQYLRTEFDVDRLLDTGEMIYKKLEDENKKFDNSGYQGNQNIIDILSRAISEWLRIADQVIECMKY